MTLANVILKDTFANRPAASIEGRLFFATDTGEIWYDNGATWDDVTPVGGSSSPLTTKGDLWGYSTVDARVPAGSDGQVLAADSAQARGIKWTAPGITTRSDVTASRAFDTVYQNTGAVAKLVQVYGYASVSGTLCFYTDAFNPPTTIAAAEHAPASSQTRTVQTWVLPGQYYKVAWDGGSQTLQKWFELT